jgi:serine phosphatase RsbU (regulator of sigma subunit)
MEALISPPIEWGVAALTRPGELNSGDLAVVSPFQCGVLVAVMDGIGHGPEAASAARMAGEVLETHSEEPVVALVQRCHNRLRGTRGVAMSLAAIDASHGLITWLGVGNVHGMLRRRTASFFASEEVLLLRAGVVGAQLPPLQATVFPVSEGDTLVFATDGIEDTYARQATWPPLPQRAADTILSQFGKSTDDALVLVAKYLGRR